jgi:hypothetical protein
MIKSTVPVPSGPQRLPHHPPRWPEPRGAPHTATASRDSHKKNPHEDSAVVTGHSHSHSHDAFHRPASVLVIPLPSPKPHGHAARPCPPPPATRTSPPQVSSRPSPSSLRVQSRGGSPTRGDSNVGNEMFISFSSCFAQWQGTVRFPTGWCCIRACLWEVVGGDPLVLGVRFPQFWGRGLCAFVHTWGCHLGNLR